MTHGLYRDKTYHYITSKKQKQKRVIETDGEKERERTDNKKKKKGRRKRSNPKMKQKICGVNIAGNMVKIASKRNKSIPGKIRPGYIRLALHPPHLPFTPSWELSISLSIISLLDYSRATVVVVVVCRWQLSSRRLSIGAGPIGACFRITTSPPTAPPYARSPGAICPRLSPQ